MFLRFDQVKDNIDWELFLLILGVSLAGVVAIYSASQSYGTETNFHYKQLFWIAVGTTVFFGVHFFNYELILRYAYVYHGVIIVLLLLVLFYGEGNRASANDVKRWLNLGVFYLQPSEFAKFTLILALAKYFNNAKLDSLRWYDLIITGLITFVPFLLIFEQPDLGTAMILPFIYAAVIFMLGLNYKIIIAVIAAVLISAPFIWTNMKPYQQGRVLTMFNPEADPMGKGYQLIQSKIAIGSGTVFGKGFLQGKQTQLNFLPAKHTDFIFSLFNEEWGFVGGILLLLVYYAFMLKCLSYLRMQKTRPGVVISSGITMMFFAHIIVNLFMVMGLMPVVGIPLPFFSYGGSSMLTMMFALGLMSSSVRMNKYQA